MGTKSKNIEYRKNEGRNKEKRSDKTIENFTRRPSHEIPKKGDNKNKQ